MRQNYKTVLSEIIELLSVIVNSLMYLGSKYQNSWIVFYKRTVARNVACQLIFQRYAKYFQLFLTQFVIIIILTNWWQYQIK